MFTLEVIRNGVRMFVHAPTREGINRRAEHVARTGGRVVRVYFPGEWV